MTRPQREDYKVEINHENGGSESIFNEKQFMEDQHEYIDYLEDKGKAIHKADQAIDDFTLIIDQNLESRRILELKREHHKKIHEILGDRIIEKTALISNLRNIMKEFHELRKLTKK